ncbi:uncharacterized protein ana2 [Drosophila virilis]|uniref:Uncharacterized protein n=1 Tax=Drosophila virilis TaxID=7244 RepID=B4LN96_DROVI|nr:uncharacterized protein LOC6626439 [Drosophila virilis]EDW60100.1 uncharacterized protein Dvir_GJ21059 [Drosophila virilis]
MFETEDMLPRSAPRPSAPIPLGHTDEIVKPTVPEVSILFGQAPQQQAQLQQQQAPVQRPANSFASWKKQILPRVNFSPVLTTELGPGNPTSATPGAISTASGGNEYNFLPRTRAFDERIAPAHSVGSNVNLGFAVSGPNQYTREAFATDDLVPKPRLPQSNATAADVLTICASTQTEPETISDLKDARPELTNLADKKDIRELLTLLETMRQEQKQLKRLCESLAQQQLQASTKTFKETASQCAILVPTKGNAAVKRITPIVHDYIVEEDELELPARQLPQFQSPHAAPPVAQSTGYRANTPQGKQSPVPQLAASALPKSNTDKTLVMNELALKYLPQRQINELMEDLHVSPKTGNDVMVNAGSNSTPLRQIDNFSPSPSNMSNASYKYLKKYRLLPEEQLGYDHHILSPQAVHKIPRSGSPAAAQHQEPMLDLDNIRNQPKLL